MVLLLMVVNSNAQWSNDSNESKLLTPNMENVYGSEMAITSDGSTYFVYNKPESVGTATYLQLINSDGEKQFGERGLLISSKRTRSYTMINQLLLVDENDNVYIAVSDCRNSPNDEVKLSYSIYKISKTGAFLWGDDGIDIDNGLSYNLEANIHMCILEDGSLVLAWVRMLSEDTPSTIQLQRLSTSGELLWNDVALEDAAVPFSYPFLENAGNNQCNLVYAKGSNQTIMVRQIDFDGNAVWPEDTKVYEGGFAESIPLQCIVSTEKGPNGGVFIGWHDDRFFTNKESAYVSYVKGNGTLGFTSGVDGERLCYQENIREFNPQMYYDDSQQALICAWRSTSAQQRWQGVTAQKVSLQGEILWGREGILVMPLDTLSVGYISISKGKENQALVSYMRHKSYDDTKAYASLINTTDGSFVWKAPLCFASALVPKGNLAMTPVINDNFWIAQWSETVATKVSSVKLKRINCDGSIGDDSSGIEEIENNGITMSAFGDNHTNMLVSIQTPNAMSVDIYVYDITGHCVSTISNHYLNSGDNLLTLPMNNVGVYFLKVKHVDYFNVVKVAIH